VECTKCSLSVCDGKDESQYANINLSHAVLVKHSPTLCEDASGSVHINVHKQVIVCKVDLHSVDVTDTNVGVASITGHRVLHD
jgi:hypothetical protein